MSTIRNTVPAAAEARICHSFQFPFIPEKQKSSQNLTFTMGKKFLFDRFFFKRKFMLMIMLSFCAVKHLQYS